MGVKVVVSVIRSRPSCLLQIREPPHLPTLPTRAKQGFPTQDSGEDDTIFADSCPNCIHGHTAEGLIISRHRRGHHMSYAFNT